ncbi:cytochrome-c oxidase, cbb3-type subunit III [Phyllobacterium ifriqiyense]|uniref:cytochrome-c oxidase, cbb3-type subunit III n=1 Tax=Phyllobacterium ifriqiyense TaxID=314238 RepID=UPI003395DE04
MSIGERDPFTGHQTTGHEWNGIKELNTPVPKPVWFFLISTAIFALVWTLLMPSWPYGTGYFKGLLGIDQKAVVSRSLVQGSAERAQWKARVEKGDWAQIQADDDLMRKIREDGRTLFGDNCAACHGTGAKGNKGFPNIAQSPMLWGDVPQIVEQTVRVGINGTDPDTRVSQMLAFGRDGTVTREQVSLLAGYVQSLSDTALITEHTKDSIASGKELFVTNCVACHGDNAKGSVDTGAPDLTDPYWIYGGDRADIYESIYSGRQGHMPSWSQRLTPVDIKIITLYVLDLRRKSMEAGAGG